MSTHVDAGTRAGAGRRPLPAYGPVEAFLGYLVFYVFVDRATPTVVEVATAALPDVSASAVGFGLAAALWFLLAVTLVDQARRQVAALRGGDGGRNAPAEPRLLGYLVLVVVGGLVAAWTFERAVVTGISLVRVVATLDVAGFPVAGFVTMVVFFVTFGVAAWALDRLVVGGLRAQLAA